MFPLLWTDYCHPREDLSISCLPLLVISPFPLSIILTPSSFHHLLLFSSGIYRVAPDASTSLLCWSPAHAGFPPRLSLCITSSSTSSISLSSQQTTILSVSFQNSVHTPFTCFLSSCFLFSPTVSFLPPVSALFPFFPLLLITLSPPRTSALSVAPRSVCQHACIFWVSCTVCCFAIKFWRDIPFFGCLMKSHRKMPVCGTEANFIHWLLAEPDAVATIVHSCNSSTCRNCGCLPKSWKDQKALKSPSVWL